MKNLFKNALLKAFREVDADSRNFGAGWEFLKLGFYNKKDYLVKVELFYCTNSFKAIINFNNPNESVRSQSSKLEKKRWDLEMGLILESQLNSINQTGVEK